MGVSKNSMIGNAGEYYVCAELCRMNILALITPKIILYLISLHLILKENVVYRYR